MDTDREIVFRVSSIRSNRLNRRVLDGDTYAIAPVVALVAGVVNGELALPEEIGAYIDAWNGRPVVLRHPKDKSGQFVTANRPDVEEAAVIGRIYNAKMDGDRLKAEMWIDVVKAEKLGGDAATVLRAMDSGQMLEVSTAYFCDIEQKKGTHNGEAYTGIQRNFRPDHLAILPDERGACSIADGCGAPRANVCGCKFADKDKVSQGDSMAKSEELAELEVLQGDAEAAVEPTDEAAPVVNAEVAPQEAQGPSQESDEAVEEITVNANDLKSVVDLVNQFGGADNLTATLLALTDIRNMIDGLGGVGAVKEALEAAANSKAEAKESVIANLAANPRVSFTRDELASMDLRTLQKIERSVSPIDYSGRAAAGAQRAEWVVYVPPALEG